MSEVEIAAKFQEILVEQLGVYSEDVTPEASFVDDLGADSLDTIELVMACEEAFNIEIPDDDAMFMVRVSDAVSYLAGRLAKVAP